MLGIDSEKTLYTHPKIGASWEGMVIEQLLAVEPHDDAWYWATHQGAEVDLVLRRGDRLYGIECKRADAPRLTRSMRTAVADLGLTAMAVVYPGERRYPLADGVEVVPLASITEPGALFRDP